jgi:hypothetical protein
VADVCINVLDYYVGNVQQHDSQYVLDYYVGDVGKCFSIHVDHHVLDHLLVY